jgi:hypothetical protein
VSTFSLSDPSFNISSIPSLAFQEAIPAELEAAIPQHQAGYVVTVDNMLKMLSIALRLKNRLPVVVMGALGLVGSAMAVHYVSGRAFKSILGMNSVEIVAVYLSSL